MSKTVKTTCPYCGVGCGVLASVDANGEVSISGDPEHPANYGRLCSKGAALADTLSMDGRLLSPQIDGVQQSWDDTLDHVAQRFMQTIEEHGPDSVAFYVSGQLLTEDYYVANKLMKGFIGTANIDTNSRLCMSSAVAAHKQAFGSDTVPACYDDLERAKLIVLIGSNTAWCHPVLFQRIRQSKITNPDLQVVVIDPRQTPTCEIADIYLSIKPGTDHVLFSGLLVYLRDHDEQHQMFINDHTRGVDEALITASGYAASIVDVAKRCGLDELQVEKFYRLFARTERVVSLFSQGINQWSNGTDRGNAIINCHLLTGRLGRPGMGPFSITGQPNAMGGREVGGLSNQLTAHMALDNPAHRQLVQSFWQSPVIADREGLKAVDLFKAIEAGKIKAVWIMATNPAVSLPDARYVRQALNTCPFVVVSDCVQHTDTTQFADVLLPALTWGEREGTVTNSERRISRQRAFLFMPGEAKADWWIVSQVARRMGFSTQFTYQGPADIFKEYATLSGVNNKGERDFDISGLKDLPDDAYEHLQPIQWPVTSVTLQGTSRMFSTGQFYTPDKRAQFIPIQDKSPKSSTTGSFPYTLNTGRVRDHWHTMTRTGKSSRLSGHVYESYAEISSHDATNVSVQQGDLILVSSAKDEVIVRANVSDNQREGSVFIPIHWNDQTSSKAVVNTLVADYTDPVSGQPEYKCTPVNISVYKPSWYGFMLSRRRLSYETARYWSCSRANNVWRTEIAGDELPNSWPTFARTMLCQQADKVEWIEYHDVATTRYRAARIENDQLESCIFISPDQELPERDWLLTLFNSNELSQQDRKSLLMGKSISGVADSGRTVCACFGVGIHALEKLICTNQLTTAEQVGVMLRAGTNCGSCVPEIQQIISSCNPS